MNDKTYAIIPIAEMGNVDFSQVEQESVSVRKTASEDKFIVKWEGGTPSSILAVSHQLFNHLEILTETDKAEWQIGSV